ncbi:unnamed protein product [Closterium sp. Yama58-4]|nr:unnamed protein product [Closterium sp. Yama58-4]
MNQKPSEEQPPFISLLCFKAGSREPVPGLVKVESIKTPTESTPRLRSGTGQGFGKVPFRFWLRLCLTVSPMHQKPSEEQPPFISLLCFKAGSRGPAPGLVKVLLKALCYAAVGVWGALHSLSPRRGERTCQQHLAGASALSTTCCFTMEAPWPAGAPQSSTMLR